MHLLAAIAFSLIAVVSCQLPCNSQLRLLPAFAHRFTHCQCSYSEWGEWERISSQPVPTSQCRSGSVVTEERTQSVIFGTCDPRVETRTICEPDLVDQIIIALGLGSTEQMIDPGAAPAPQPVPFRPPPNAFYRPLRPTSCDDTRKTCQHVTVDHGKRSVREELKRPINRQRRSTAEPEPLPFKPTQFNMTEHGHRYRRQSRCGPNSTQYILFVLDTSGSVGKSEFDRATAVLSELVLFFCHPIKIAVMTFDHEYFVEFCFDCFDNTCGGRVNAGDAISSINYGYSRSGTRWTHTAGAALCVCDFMLTEICGVPVASDCIDVVFITDGRSNDPNLNVCDEIACLHDRYGVTTYAIGIANAYQQQLECISNADPDFFHLFNFFDFDEFEDTFHELVDRLQNATTGDPYVCIGTGGVGTAGCNK
ncbi:Integrin alpha-X [Geodia barretti]|uniref:Integrin alpha-X n=1 Tax=Geodia barretti TaxID=519541 RepID=A0AA35X034_GEOBA|nr:Integrin alpha-X [Geodia barretti]